MKKQENSQFCQNKDILWSHGIISKKGPRDNQTDCEVDNFLIHIPSGTVKRFHGSWYTVGYAEEMKRWILQFPEGDDKKIEVLALRKYYDLLLYELMELI